MHIYEDCSAVGRRTFTVRQVDGGYLSQYRSKGCLSIVNEGSKVTVKISGPGALDASFELSFGEAQKVARVLSWIV